jgi:hypothetical protein
MSLLTMFTCNAIPFDFPDNDRSIAARRFRSRKMAKEFSCRDAAQQVEQHLLMTTVVDEAVDAFREAVVHHRDQTPLGKTIAPLRQPPNSPNNAISFEFPELPINDDDGLGSSASRNRARDLSPAKTFTRMSRGRRSQRKRRRVPSFKTKTEPRVPSKLSTRDITVASEADDEASDSEDATTTFRMATSTFDQDMGYITKATRDLECKLGDSSSDEEDELKLKLKVLSEVRHFCEDKSVTDLEKTDWAKVGSELRQIADKFSSESSTGSSGEEDAVDGQAANVSGDFVSLINLMLPFSVPQSLWSALVSYAAWKIFKRFQ